MASEVRDFSVGKLAPKLFGHICSGFVMFANKIASGGI